MHIMESTLDRSPPFSRDEYSLDAVPGMCLGSVRWRKLLNCANRADLGWIRLSGRAGGGGDRRSTSEEESVFSVSDS